ncbi:MAG: hypothetical protein CVU20_06630 [Betaproteobacteria bacterium HGW-Betaproteobacteria-14]|nr:MAG: hypothetical protein CVU20_06630 [Betaproteobacteria bacterium HGW-Betaproteobacteria-14]
MFWTFIMVVALALVFVQLGIYSVWVTVLAGLLQFALLVIGFLTIALVWRKVSRKVDAKRSGH